MRWNRSLAVSLLLSLWATAADPARLVHKKKYAMGTTFDIVAYDVSPSHADGAIEAAFQQILRLDGVMSNYRSESDLSWLNRCAHDYACVVSPDLYRVIAEALHYSELSNGKFDITVGPLVDYWKAQRNGERKPSRSEEQHLRDCIGYQRIRLLAPNRIQFRSPCLALDLGGIGKGYAVDRAVDVLRSFGITRALINAGNSTIFAMGSPPGESAWVVHLRDPSGKVDPQVRLRDNSVSTSEQTAPGVLEDSGGHIIDPETGAPVQASIAISVIAPTATASDALSTTLFLLGAENGKRLVDSLLETAAIWISPAGQTVVASSGPQIVLRKQGVQQHPDHAAVLQHSTH